MGDCPQCCKASGPDVGGYVVCPTCELSNECSDPKRARRALTDARAHAARLREALDDCAEAMIGLSDNILKSLKDCDDSDTYCGWGVGQYRHMRRAKDNAHTILSTTQPAAEWLAARVTEKWQQREREVIERLMAEADLMCGEDVASALKGLAQACGFLPAPPAETPSP